MIDKKTIEHMAKLSRIKISENDVMEYSTQMAGILSYFEQISKVNTDNVVPLVTPSEIEGFWREDEAQQKYLVEEMLKNAPDRVGNLFKVPPVVSEG